MNISNNGAPSILSNTITFLEWTPTEGLVIFGTARYEQSLGYFGMDLRFGVQGGKILVKK